MSLHGDGSTMPATPTALLHARAQARPDGPALIDRDRPLGYSELETLSRRLATGLAQAGIGVGDRVALWLPNLPAWLAFFLACARLGAIAVSVNTRFKSVELADIVGRSGCKLLVYWPSFRGIDFAGILDSIEKPALPELTGLVEYSEEGGAAARHRASTGPLGLPQRLYADLAACPPMREDHARPEAGCVIFTTSGTTKAPKFVLHDQQTIVRHARDVAARFGYTAPDAVVLVSVPLCGVFGFCNAMAALTASRPLVMAPTFNAEEAAGMINRHRVTHTNATDDMIAQLLAVLPDDRPYPSLRAVGYGEFSSQYPEIVARADARGIKLFGLYGASEVQALFSRRDPADTVSRRMLGGGLPVAAEARVRVRDIESRALLPHGESGEIEIHAPSRMVGYFGNDEATAAALTPDGFFRTGDLGYTEADGGFVYLARLGDALRLGGFLVSPAEIEAVIEEHPSVAGCQVVGLTTPIGLQVVAFVVLAPAASLDEAALIAHCTSRMAKFRVPQRIHAIDAFPVTPGANATKVQKSKLRELARKDL